jgi:hypothetical protein
MKAEAIRKTSKSLEVTGLLLSTLLALAVFVAGVLRAESAMVSGFSAPTNEQAVLADDTPTYGQW